MHDKDNIQHPKVFIETYGCQMNVADSEVVMALLQSEGYRYTADMEKAAVILINTCSIRENAEDRVRKRLANIKHLKKRKDGPLIGVIGCMAERLREKLLEQEQAVDLLAGPDAYRRLPLLLEQAREGAKATDVKLSKQETYAGIDPLRYGPNKVSAFVSIMRGCDNMCAYCVVPFTRGRERSREPQTIIDEVQTLSRQGYKEVTLLGQNVDKYLWQDKHGFADLLRQTAEKAPGMRVRFATSYPGHMSDQVLDVMATYENICKNIHLPVQSGSDLVLERMKRGYTRAQYLERIRRIRHYMPDCGISTDIITGFCGETAEDHRQTLALMKEAAFDFAYMFKYSERPNTYAQRKYEDDVPKAEKTRRLEEVIDLQQSLSAASNRADVGKTFEVLAEKVSKRSKEHLTGRNSQNKVVIFPKGPHQAGDLLQVRITGCSPATLKGECL